MSASGVQESRGGARRGPRFRITARPHLLPRMPDGWAFLRSLRPRPCRLCKLNFENAGSTDLRFSDSGA